MCVFKRNINVQETITILHEIIHEEERLIETYKTLSHHVRYLEEEKKVTHLKILLSALRCNGPGS